MRVNLLKLYQSYNKIFIPGEYDNSELPLAIRNNPDYVEEIVTNPLITSVVISEPVTIKLGRRRKELIAEEQESTNESDD